MENEGVLEEIKRKCPKQNSILAPTFSLSSFRERGQKEPWNSCLLGGGVGSRDGGGTVKKEE